MDWTKPKKHLTHALLAFVLISIGFSAGKRAASREDGPPVLPDRSGRQVAIYYLHTTRRCTTCNTLETMTEDLLKNSYPRQLTDGTVAWIPIDYQKQTDIAKRFDVSSGCIVVAEIENGRILRYERREDIWSLRKDPDAFNASIRNTIDTYLNE